MPKVRQINLRISEELRRKLDRVAKREEMSVNAVMRKLLRDGLETNPLLTLTKPHPSNHRED